jgi:thiol-disulfide isomerase/thioredoxin
MMKRNRPLASFAIGAMLLILSPGAAPANNERTEQAPELDVGWQWAIEPTELREGWRSNGFTRLFSHGGLTLSETPEGNVLAVLSQSVDLDKRGSASPEFRLVVLDDRGEELRTAGWSKSANQAIQITNFRIAGKAESVERVALAMLDLEGRKKLSEVAMRDAEHTGASAMPLPVIGEPIEFDLPTMDGGRLRSDDLKGSVVLIDCWATWCGPCMAKMPELKKAHETFRDEGLVIIGVNFDDDRSKARAAIEQGDFHWHHVHAGDAARGIDDLWERATGISTIPRLILIDREGVVIDDFYPHDLAERIEEAID